MKAHRIFLILIYFIITAFKCNKNDSSLCHDFKVEITYDAQNGFLTAQTSGGVPPIIYQWSTGGGSDFIIANNKGIYGVQATDFRKCVALATFEIK